MSDSVYLGKEKAVKKIVSYISGFMCGLFAFVSLVSGIVRVTVCNKDFYINALTDSEYIDSMYELAGDELKTACRIYSFPYESVKGVLTRDLVSALCTEYASNLYDSISYDGTLNEVDINNDIFINAIDEYANENSSAILQDENNRKELAGIFASTITNAVNAIPDISTVSVINTAFRIVSSFRITDVFIVALIFAVGFGFLYFVARRRHVQKKQTIAYKLFGVLLLFNTIVFVPFLVLTTSNAAANLPLAYSPLAVCVKAIATRFISFGFTVTSLLETAFLVLTFIFAVSTAKLRNRHE